MGKRSKHTDFLDSTLSLPRVIESSFNYSFSHMRLKCSFTLFKVHEWKNREIRGTLRTHNIIKRNTTLNLLILQEKNVNYPYLLRKLSIEDELLSGLLDTSKVKRRRIGSLEISRLLDDNLPDVNLFLLIKE